MDNQLIEAIIKKTVDAGSVTSEPDYTILVGVIGIMIATFLLITRHMGKQIIKSNEESSKRRETLLEQMNKNITGHQEKLVAHEVKINHNEKQISGLWEKVNG